MVEQDNVVRNLFIPDECFEGEAKDFIANVTKIDADFEQKRAETEREGKNLRFVASLNKGNVSVGLQAVTPDHPFFNLAGSNNVVLITTERYNEYPMAIKGYGAGAEVTAAGVFSDIIGIANIR